MGVQPEVVVGPGVRGVRPEMKSFRMESRLQGKQEPEKTRGVPVRRGEERRERRVTRHPGRGAAHALRGGQQQRNHLSPLDSVHFSWLAEEKDFFLERVYGTLPLQTSWALPKTFLS